MFIALIFSLFFSDKKSGTLVLICELMDMNIYELIRGELVRRLKKFISEIWHMKYLLKWQYLCNNKSKRNQIIKGINYVF